MSILTTLARQVKKFRAWIDLIRLESRIRDDRFDRALSVEIDKAVTKFESLGGRR